MWTIVESSADKTALLPEFDEPLILGEGPRAPGNWQKTMAYLAGCIFLLMILIAQIFFHYQDYFFRHTSWRPLIASACEQLGCQLPAVENAAALRSAYLSVNPHPGFQNLLQVTFRIQNVATYPQAYPAVVLSFSDTRDKLVATRRFDPGHYLPASTLAAGIMAAGAELDGILEISNPDEDAVNYRLEFVYDSN